jgi:hypothetical protein
MMWATLMSAKDSTSQRTSPGSFLVVAAIKAKTAFLFLRCNITLGTGQSIEVESIKTGGGALR